MRIFNADALRAVQKERRITILDRNCPWGIIDKRGEGLVPERIICALFCTHVTKE
jgi:hypothetical protein